MTAPQSRPGVAFPVGATHPTPDVETWLDERTEAELQPQCEVGDGPCGCGVCLGGPSTAHGRCFAPAAEVLVGDCGACGLSVRALACAPHIAEALEVCVDGMAGCRRCQAAIHVHTELLR